MKAGQQIGSEHAFESLNLGMMLRAEGNLEGARSTVQAALRRSRRNGDNRSMAGACLHLACLADDPGDRDRAAVPHGIAQAFKDRTSVP